MRNLFILSALLFLTTTIIAQAPQKFSYQAVIRNASNNLVTNQLVGMRISILEGSTSGPEVYKETYSPNPQTNSNGLVSVEIGSGIPVAGVFANINWGNGPYFVKIETDPTGGTNYTITGTNQLLSVPYALYANNVIDYKPGTGISIVGNTISATAGTDATALTLVPLPAVPVDNSGNSPQGVNDNTIGNIGQIIVPFSITVNKISIKTGATILTPGKVAISLFSEDGQTQIFNITTADLSSSSTIYTTAVPSVLINPGIYYLMIQSIGTTNAQIFFYSVAQHPFFASGLQGSVASEPVMYGTYNVSPDVVPSTITPLSITVSGQRPTVIVRFDN